MTTFKELGLNHEILKSLNDLGFVEPSPVQEKAIPFILKSKKDLTALAQTGTGKTAAFGLPILNQIRNRGLQVIILCPTRELCMQITEDLKKLAKYSKGVGITAVYGGERIDIQARSLRKANIVVGTPGRVVDLIRRKSLRLQSIDWLVLDEADEMLDMGFKDDLDTILEQTPKSRRTLLFSATMCRSVQNIAKNYMNDAEEISIGENNVGADNVSHEYYVVQLRDRFEALKRILGNLPGVYGILFCRTRHETQDVADKLKQAGYNTEALHGDISQNVRTKIMSRFKTKQIQLLVATDVAARGIDVNNLTHIINYKLPDKNQGYTHRSGRTGRAGQSGICISLVGARELRIVKELENMIGKKFEHKTVPTGEDICKGQINNFIEELEKIDISQVDNEKYFTDVIKGLNKINKEDLIKYFVAHKFNHLIDTYKNMGELSVDAKPFERAPGEEDESSLQINLGKQHGLDIKYFFNLINSNKSLKGIKVGGISLMPEYSLFSVADKYVDEIIKCLSNSNFRGRKIKVNRTKEKPNYPRRGSDSRPRRRSRQRRNAPRYSR